MMKKTFLFQGWKPLLAFLPLIWPGFLVYAVSSGEREVIGLTGIWQAIALFGLVGTWASWSLSRVFAKTPVLIGAAADGEVALEGVARVARVLSGREQVISPYSKVPCVWYYYRQNSSGKTSIGTIRESSDPFLLVDGSGECLIDPAGAEVSGGTILKNGLFHERLIKEGEPIYGIGLFKRYGEGDAGRPSLQARGFAQSLMIGAGKIKEQRGWYGLLLWLDVGILVVALGVLAVKFGEIPH